MIVRTARLLALAAAAAVCMPALATGTPHCGTKGNPCKPTPKPNPKPTPKPTPNTSSSGSTSTSGAASTSSSTALAGAAGIASVGDVGGGSATVGDISSSSAGGAADLKSHIDVDAAPSITDSSSNSSRAWSLFLPPPAWTPPMAPVSCPSANIEQGSTAVFWSGFSNATAKTDSSDCTLIQVRNAKVEACQFASAKQIEDLLVSKYLKNYQPSTVGMVDYTDKECAVLKLAAQPKPEPVVYPLAPLADKPAEPAPAAKPTPCAKGQKRNSKGVCYTPKPPCDEGKVLACTLPGAK